MRNLSYGSGEVAGVQDIPPTEVIGIRQVIRVLPPEEQDSTGYDVSVSTCFETLNSVREIPGCFLGMKNTITSLSFLQACNPDVPVCFQNECGIVTPMGTLGYHLAVASL